MDDFDGWYRKEHPRVLAACAALGGDIDAAVDATDEAFVRALERWTKVAGMVSPGGWVQVVALNHLRRHLRRGRKLRAGAGSENPKTVDLIVPDPALWAAVAALPSRQRTATVLRYVHDLPGAAIAETMGISRGTVASTLAAAQTNLRRHLPDPLAGDVPDTHEEKQHG